MFRILFRLLIVLVIALFVRQALAIIVRAFSQAAPGGGDTPRSAGRLDRELKKDPVCGTFVAAASSIKRNVNGEVIHFCSTTCRDKYRIA